LGAQLLLTVLGGGLGLFVATPLTIALIITVQVLYVRDVLHEDVTLLGEHEPDSQPPDYEHTDSAAPSL
jgi:hypothetical protein